MLKQSTKKRQRKFAWFMSLILILLNVLTIPVFVHANDTIDVYIDVEGYNLGQGFYIQPTKLTLQKSATAEDATRKLLEQVRKSYESTGSKTSFYLARINGINDGHINLPSYITTEVDASDGQAGTLGEFDYTPSAGWTITVNHDKISVGAGAKVLNDKDVIRWQFTVQGFGDDIGVGPSALYPHANKTELIRLLDSFEQQSTLKSEALDIIINPLATQQDVDAFIEKAKNIITPKDETETEDTNKDKDTESSSSQESSNDDKPTENNVNELKKVLAERCDVAKSHQMNKHLYTTESLKQLDEAVDNAKQVLLNATATQEDVQQVISALNQSIQKLTKIPSTNKSVDVTDALEKALQKIETDVVANKNYLGINFEWDILSLARGDVQNNGLYSNYYHAMVDYLKKNYDSQTGKLRLNGSNRLDKRSTEMSRIILALTAIGKSADNIEGMDLFKSFTNIKHLNYQGINGSIFALIAINTKPYSNASILYARQQLLDDILSKQLPDGGWSLTSPTFDSDITAMVLQSLAPYYKQKDKRVVEVVDKALVTLSTAMLPTGGFGSSAVENQENTPSIAQVVTALSELGIDVATDARFNQNGHNPLTALLSYQLPNGAFYYTKDKNNETDKFSTEQGTYALVAYHRLQTKQNRLYEMSDAKLVDTNISNPINPNKDNTNPSENNNQGIIEEPQDIPQPRQENNMLQQLGGSTVVNQQNISNVDTMNRQIVNNTTKESINMVKKDDEQSSSHKDKTKETEKVLTVHQETTTHVNWWMYLWIVVMGAIGLLVIFILKKKNVW